MRFSITVILITYFKCSYVFGDSSTTTESDNEEVENASNLFRRCSKRFTPGSCRTQVKSVWAYDYLDNNCTERLGCPPNPRSNRFENFKICLKGCWPLIKVQLGLQIRNYMTQLTRNTTDESPTHDDILFRRFGLDSADEGKKIDYEYETERTVNYYVYHDENDYDEDTERKESTADIDNFWQRYTLDDSQEDEFTQGEENKTNPSEVYDYYARNMDSDENDSELIDDDSLVTDTILNILRRHSKGTPKPPILNTVDAVNTNNDEDVSIYELLEKVGITNIRRRENKSETDEDLFNGEENVGDGDIDKYDNDAFYKIFGVKNSQTIDENQDKTSPTMEKDKLDTNDDHGDISSSEDVTEQNLYDIDNSDSMSDNYVKNNIHNSYLYHDQEAAP